MRLSDLGELSSQQEAALRFEVIVGGITGIVITLGISALVTVNLLLSEVGLAWAILGGICACFFVGLFVLVLMVCRIYQLASFAALLGKTGAPSRRNDVF